MKKIAAVLAAIVLAGAAGAAVFYFGGQKQQPSPGEKKQTASSDGASKQTASGGSASLRQPGFRDMAPEAGLSFRMGFLPGEQGEKFKVNLYDHGCGVAVADFDNDGREDLYFCNQVGSNALYRNQGDGQFADVTKEMGVGLEDRICVAATFADYDNDGDQDLYVASTRGGNVLFRNEEGKRFTDVSQEAGVGHVGHTQGAVFFDYDNDGRLDLYLLQTADWTSGEFDEEYKYYVSRPGVFTCPKEYNILYRNLGDGRFEDVSEKANAPGRGWSGDAAILDYDEDGWFDIVLACMFGPSQLYRNQRDGSFRDVTAEVLGRTPCGGVSVRLLDIDSDGRLDIYIVDMHSDMWMGLDSKHEFQRLAAESEDVRFPNFYGPRVHDSSEFQALEVQMQNVVGFKHTEVLYGNACYRSLGAGKYEEVSQKYDLENLWPWAIAPGDFDNDGHEDMLVTSGMGYPFWYWHNYLLMNTGQGRFFERSLELGVEPPRGGAYLKEKIGGKRCAKSSRGAATGDFDNDGRLEIVTNNFNSTPYFFRNEFPKKNYIAFRLRGQRSNRDAIGAVVHVTSGDKTLVRQVQTAGGFLSQSSSRLHFGLGDSQQVDRVEIAWPSGERQKVERPQINRLHSIVEQATATGA